MPALLQLAQNSIGVGDRFARQAKAQLRACLLAEQEGEIVVPVWNKSHREHAIIGSEPAATRHAADAAAHDLGWQHPWFVDADHIGMNTIDRFLAHADFFTIDVADWIGKPADETSVGQFVWRHPGLIGRIDITNSSDPFMTVREDLERTARKYLAAIQEAGRVYRRIAAAKGEGTFVTEISMDETDSPQTPIELLIILAAVADEGVPIQTIAPKFSGRFNKGVDYSGSAENFEKEFCENVAVLSYAVREFSLPESLKLSIHSGSDKFSIYEPMRRVLRKFKTGVHLKTAGTTWLEELIGLAEAGGAGLALAIEIYGEALNHMDELSRPYAAVIEIDRTKLPSAAAVKSWTSEQYVSALRHDPTNPQFNPHLRQLLHVGYKVAAAMGRRFLDALEEHRPAIERNVTENLFERHIKPLFLRPGHGRESMPARASETDNRHIMRSSDRRNRGRSE